MSTEKNLPLMLIAETDENNRAELKNIFCDEFEIIEAVDGFGCLELMEKNKIEIVLAALQMPMMNGFEVLKSVAKDERFEEIPIIVTTNREDTDGEAQAMTLGAAEFLTTPFNKITARCRVKNVLAQFENKRHVLEKEAKDKRIIEMHRYMEIDNLTGLYNRETFYKKAAALMQENPDTKYYIVYLDISCFKAVNDLFHLETGNLILKTAANYFMNEINTQDGISSRIEADHFVLCVPQNKLDIEQLISGLDVAIQSLGISHNILFFAGVYPVNNAFLPVDQMCDRASMALQKIKGNYVTRYAYYDASMREFMLQEQMIVRDMEFALQDEQFTIYLQPIYRPETDSIVSAEALVRWFHPVNGMISPGYFIPVFERNGFIVRLDRFVWESVCKFIRGQIDSGKKVVPVSVNVSRLNFYNLDLLDFLTGLLEKYKLEPWMLKLEITESAYTDNPQQLISIVKMFREQGFAVLMDDFGSGYSSLNMLKNMPIDILKVDMAFIRELEHSPRSVIILRSILGLAKELNMGVVTEGVETKAQLENIMSMGAADIQGYYFSRPLPVEDFKTLLETYGQEKSDDKE